MLNGCVRFVVIAVESRNRPIIPRLSRYDGDATVRIKYRTTAACLGILSRYDSNSHVYFIRARTTYACTVDYHRSIV